MLVADTDEAAEALDQQLVELESPETGFGFPSRTFNDHDFRHYDFDAPFPDVEHIGLNSQQSASLRILQARGLFHAGYEGDTFRETLGLPIPLNRHTAARAGRTAT